jgi:hypothetical protein
VCCEDLPFSYVVNFHFYRTIRHVEGDVILQIPYIAALHQKDTSVQSLAKDFHLKDQLEEVVMSWERHVTTVIDNYLTKVQRIERPGFRKYCTLLGCLCLCVCVCVWLYVYMYVRTCVFIYHVRTSDEGQTYGHDEANSRYFCHATVLKPVCILMLLCTFSEILHEVSGNSYTEYIQ